MFINNMNMNMNNIQYTSYDDASTRTFKHQHVVASRPKKFERYLYNTVLLGQLNSIVKLNTNTNTNSD